mgnify:CR=1 FL=1
MAHQIAAKVVTHGVTDVIYHRHRKDGSPDSMRVEYWSGLRCVAKEWICFEHGGFARAKADNWWTWRGGPNLPRTTGEALERSPALRTPSAVIVNESGKWPEIVRMDWGNRDQVGTASDDDSGTALHAAPGNDQAVVQQL